MIIVQQQISLKKLFIQRIIIPLKSMQQRCISHKTTKFSPSQLMKAIDTQKRSKVLPHITEEYEFRITNRLLIDKITNPRRDKTIVDSLTNVTSRLFLNRKKNILPVEKSVIYRRKIIGNRNLQKQDSFAQTEQFGKVKHQIQICSRIQMKESKQEKDDICAYSKNCNMTQSKTVQTQESSMRDNFVGKIIRNMHSMKKRDHSDLSLTVSKNFQSGQLNRFKGQDDPFQQIDNSIQLWRGKDQMKKIVRRFNNHNHNIYYNKQNIGDMTESKELEQIV